MEFHEISWNFIDRKKTENIWYKVRIPWRGKPILLGIYETPEEAEKVWSTANEAKTNGRLMEYLVGILNGVFPHRRSRRWEARISIPDCDTWYAVGIYRSEESLRTSCDTIRELKQRFNQIELADHSLTFNTELTTALELEYMLDISEALVHSALARTESRGSHQRTDYPERDDQRFLKHSLAYSSDRDPRIEYQDVTITRWPPGERVYGSK